MARRRELIGAALAAVPLTAAARTGAAARRIATEEAYTLPEVAAATNAWLAAHPGSEPGLLAMRASIGRDIGMAWGRSLVDFGPGRLAAMDAARIDTQLLLLSSPGVQIFDPSQASELARLCNDRIVAFARGNPGRFAGLGVIAPQDPVGAARELERAMGLGMSGVVINSHTRGHYLDEPAFTPILEAAQAQNCPIYLHPREPSPAMLAPYQPYGLQGPLWGYAAETGLHALRLILAGVFDRYPRLQIVLGHLGEGLPYFADRIDIRYRLDGSPLRPKLKQLPSWYLRNNFYLTTSGMNWGPAIGAALAVMGPDRLMFAADWPFEDAPAASRSFDAVAMAADVRRRVLHGTAERLFRIAPRAG